MNNFGLLAPLAGALLVGVLLGLLAFPLWRWTAGDRASRQALIRALDAAQQANASKSSFLATMSHEIRTPMSGVLGMTELCLQTDLTPEQRSYLELSEASAKSLLTLVNDILDFSKIEACKLELDCQAFSLRALLRQITRTLSLSTAEKDLELVCDVDPDVPDRVVGAALRLQQVISNLLANAIKFTAQGEVTLRVSTLSPVSGIDGVWLKVEVQDTGIGISPAKKSVIFEAFTQADATTARCFGGSGLGLSICRSLVELMGGAIRVDSQVGQGSTFGFTVHLQASDVAGHAPAPVPAEGQGQSVVVVDDNASSRHTLAKQLRHLGLRVVAFESAKALLQWPTTELKQAACVLIDTQMPELDGYSLAQQLRRQPDLQTLPLVMMGSLSQKISQKNAEHLQLQGFLAKPIDQQELRQQLSRLAQASPPASLRVRDVGSSPAPARVNTGKALLLEDTPVNQALESILLQRLGYDVTLLSNGVAGVDAFQYARYDLALIDIEMPEMGGLEATQRMRAIEHAQARKRTPLVAVTANALKGDRERYVAAGFDGYVSKPLTMHSLQQEIDRVLTQNGV